MIFFFRVKERVDGRTAGGVTMALRDLGPQAAPGFHPTAAMIEIGAATQWFVVIGDRDPNAINTRAVTFLPTTANVAGQPELGVTRKVHFEDSRE